jgi:hypothetical protein
MPHSAVNLTPLFHIIRTPKRPLFLMLWGLLAMISTVSLVPAIASVSCVDLMIILLPWGPLALGIQKSSPGFGGLYAYIGDYKQIGHRLGLLRGDLLHSLDIADPFAEGIDDLDVLDVWDSIPSIAKTFHIVPKTFTMLLPNGL